MSTTDPHGPQRPHDAGQWTADDPEAVEAAVAAFRAELDRGYFGMVTTGAGQAEQVRELPVGAELVILRLPIAGG